MKWKNLFTCGVILASGGYPGSYKKGNLITGANRINDENNIVFHAGTKYTSNKYYTNGK